MIKNYLKIAFRTIQKQKFYALVNIFGLTVGLTSVILIVLYVNDELSYDKFHSDYDRIYRVVENQYYADQPVFPVAVTPGPLAPSLKADFPEIEYATRVNFNNDRFDYGNESFIESGAFVDKDFFNVFSFNLIKGNPESVFNQINALVIDENLAAKYFADVDPIGKLIKLNGNKEMIVTGVMQNVPENSHIKFSYLMSTDLLRTHWDGLDNAWGNNTLYTYVKVQDGIKLNELNSKIKEQIKRNREGSVTDIYLQPLTAIHLDEVNFTADVDGKGNIVYVDIFSIVALFILFIACINFMNLATARSMKRAKEVGLRKTVGASRYQLIYQFLGESILMSTIATLLAILLVDLLLPAFNNLAGKSLELHLLDSANGFKILLLLFAAAIATGVLAGSYPAVFLSSFKPTTVLKGQKVKGGGLFRKVLVVLQFTVSIVLLIGTITISNQLDYIQSKNLGINKDQVVYIRSLSDDYQIFKDELENQQGIISVGLSNQHPAYVQNSTSGISWEGANPDETILIHLEAVDPGYIPTMQIELVAGRNFSDQIKSDTSAVIINETALKLIGYTDPIGAKLFAGDERTIIGVAKDFNFKSVHQAIEPLVLFMDPDRYSRTFIKIDKENIKESMAKIKAEWIKLNPESTFNATFLDEDFNQLYASEQRTSTLFNFFSVLAIIISCLGLFGLSSYMAEQRTKELSIRKVLGASIGSLFYLVSKDFTALVLLAFLIAIPISTYFMNSWLDSFAYKIHLGATVFILAGVSALVIALVTVSYQSLNAAKSNPVNTLKGE
ncbi:MAG TPA: ABC transporter permease [Fulvivirga sp.]|nr:ABC transporter permease [Fulvivirga sp.]